MASATSGFREEGSSRSASPAEDPFHPGRLRILIVDDHRLFAGGLASILRGLGMEIVGVATRGLEGMALAKAGHPDLAIVDLSLPDIDGLVVARRIRRELPDTRLMAVTGLEDPGLAGAALRSGFHAYVRKHASLPELLAAINAVSRSLTVVPSELGGFLERPDRDADGAGGLIQDGERLTTRERQILSLLANGGTGRQIADELGLSPTTVRTHIQNIRAKLRLGSRLEATALVAGLGSPAARPHRGGVRAGSPTR